MSIPLREDYTSGEVLEDQLGTGSVLQFNFSETIYLLVLMSVGGISRANPFGGVPDEDTGIYLDDGIPTYIPVATEQVKVYASNGVRIIVYGLSRT